jgi:hypothetical protein
MRFEDFVLYVALTQHSCHQPQSHSPCAVPV